MSHIIFKTWKSCFLGVFLVALLFGTTRQTLATTFSTVDFSQHHNARLQGRNPAYPEGNVVLGGVPFNIPVGGNNEWKHGDSGLGGDGQAFVEIFVDLPGAVSVHTLINTLWGTTSGGRMLVEFFGIDGAYHQQDLIGNNHIRDWGLNSTSSINGTTTTNVATITPGIGGSSDVLDKQVFVLPVDFHDESLDAIRITDNRTTFVHGGILSGITVEIIPEPGAGLLLAVGLALLWRRNL